MSVDFCDTNIVLYTMSWDVRKASIAEGVLRTRPTISTQVLNEFAHVARRKLRLPWAELVPLLTKLQANCPVIPLTLDIHRQGLELAKRYGLSVYDAMIVSAALAAGCDRLWSEDMQHGLLVDKRLSIVNPFL